MSKAEKLVESVLQAADGSVIGRVRLQKIFYLLQQVGLSAPFRFSYYHYGPYSEDLSVALNRARDLDKTIEEEEIKSQDGFYSVYALRDEQGTKSEMVGNLTFDKAHELVAMMKSETSTVIELAATIHWLREKEKVPDWQSELKIRKGSKADDVRIKKAVALLNKLDLDG